MTPFFRPLGVVRWLTGPAEAETPAPPPEVDTVELAAMRESALLDLAGRVVAAVELIDELLLFHRDRGRVLRPEDLPNALLDVRNRLAPGSSMLPLRPSVPVVPGPTS